jgi:hypothetical protein
MRPAGAVEGLRTRCPRNTVGWSHDPTRVLANGFVLIMAAARNTGSRTHSCLCRSASQVF